MNKKKTSSFTASLVVSGVSLAATAASLALHKDALDLKGGIPTLLFGLSLIYASTQFAKSCYSEELPDCYGSDVKERAKTAFKIKIGVQAVYCVMNVIALMNPNITDNEFYWTSAALIFNAAFAYSYWTRYKKCDSKNSIANNTDEFLCNDEMRSALISAVVQFALFAGCQSYSVSYAGSISTIFSPIIYVIIGKMINNKEHKEV